MNKTPINRRTFIINALRLSILGLFALSFERRNNISVERFKLSYSNLPDSFNGFKIVHISDIHASYWVTEAYLLKVVEQINSLPKDLVVITGDILTGSVNSFWKKWIPSGDKDYIAMVADVLSRLKCENKIAVLGNHDQGDSFANEQRLVIELEKIGIRVLRNESLNITRKNEQIFIAGTDDYWNTCDLSRTLSKVPDKAFSILLSHNPDITGDMNTETKADLVLCGHTHGGQIRIPYLSRYYMPIKNPDRYIAGLVKEPFGYTYVNRGIGTLVFPFRLNAPPEITYLQLTCL
ncbi:metallophosphoesterase [Desulfobacterales bacterium HSG17]|nr:metallophosphoesterase [Desulfobacterales bacterium HSG17]